MCHEADTKTVGSLFNRQIFSPFSPRGNVPSKILWDKTPCIAITPKWTVNNKNGGKITIKPRPDTTTKQRERETEPTSQEFDSNSSINTMEIASSYDIFKLHLDHLQHWNIKVKMTATGLESRTT